MAPFLLHSQSARRAAELPVATGSRDV